MAETISERVARRFQQASGPSLPERVAARFKEAAGMVLGPGGLEKPGGTGVTLQEGAAYYLGASSSPKFIILTKVGDDMLRYKEYPFTGKEYTIQRWIGADLIEKGTKTHLRQYGRYMDPGLKKSMESLLRGGKGRKEKIDDYRPVTVMVEPADDLKGQDLWRAAEEYGGVAGLVGDDDKIYQYKIETSKGQVEKIKSDRRFKVLKVQNR